MISNSKQSNAVEIQKRIDKALELQRIDNRNLPRYYHYDAKGNLKPNWKKIRTWKAD